MVPAKKQSAGDLNLVDASSLFDVTEALADQDNQSKVTFDYPRLKEVLETERLSNGWRPAVKTMAFLARDPESEGQRRFKDMLEMNDYRVLDYHYRDTFVSRPAGHTPTEASSKPITSLAAKLAYTIGLLAGYDGPQVLVVTHCFELCDQLEDFAHRVKENDGRVGLAYFSTFLDGRWRRTGLLEGESPIEFIDLDPHGSELVGIDFAPSGPRSTASSERRYSNF